MQRMIGAGLILIGAATYGAGLARAIRSRARELTTLEAALQVLETEVTYGQTPLPDACRQVSRLVEPPVAALFRFAGDALARPGGEGVGPTWSRVVRAWAANTHLHSKETHILEAMGATLGRSGPEEQVRLLRLAGERLKQVRQGLEGDLEKQCRLRLYLGAATGAILALLLV